MINSFGNKETEKIWIGLRTKKMPNKIQNIARRKLRMINNTQNINDLRKPSPDELEMLYGNLAEYNSIRINEQWRVIFKWINSEAFDVEIVENI